MHVVQIHTLRHTGKTKKYMLLETIYICQLDSETLSQEGMGKQRRPENETWLVECLPSLNRDLVLYPQHHVYWMWCYTFVFPALGE